MVLIGLIAGRRDGVMDQMGGTMKEMDGTMDEIRILTRSYGTTWYY